MPYIWEQEDWDNFRNWGDKVRVEVRFVPGPGADDPVEDWIILPMGRASWSQDWLLRQVEALGHTDSGEPVYVLTLQDRKVSWGGDASNYQILLDVFVGVLGGAIWDGVRLLASQLASHLRDGDQGFTARPLTDSEAEARARWVVSERYDVSHDELQVVSVEHTDEQASAELKGPDGTGYTVELTTIDGLVVIGKIRRRPGQTSIGQP